MSPCDSWQAGGGLLRSSHPRFFSGFDFTQEEKLTLQIDSAVEKQEGWEEMPSVAFATVRNQYCSTNWPHVSALQLQDPDQQKIPLQHLDEDY